MLPSTHSTVSAIETYISELNTDSVCSLSTLNRVTFSAQDSLSGDWLNLASVGVPPTGVVRPYLGAPDVDHLLYQSIELPAEDSFGLLMPKDCPLAEREEIRLSDLMGLPVIVSRAAEPYLAGSVELSSLNVVATYNLVYNASLLVEDALGYAICFDKLINTSGNSRLCMRPIVPQMKAAGYLIWKKYQVFSPAVQMFIDRICSTIH